MPVLRETIEVDVPVDVAFAMVADFSTSEQWDPGVANARLVKPGAGADAGVGAEYALTVTFRGNTSDMTYITTAYEAPRRVVIEGVGPRIGPSTPSSSSPSPPVGRGSSTRRISGSPAPPRSLGRSSAVPSNRWATTRSPGCDRGSPRPPRPARRSRCRSEWGQARSPGGHATSAGCLFAPIRGPSRGTVTRHHSDASSS